MKFRIQYLHEKMGVTFEIKNRRGFTIYKMKTEIFQRFDISFNRYFVRFALSGLIMYFLYKL